MVIGVSTYQLHLDGCRSLKEKRFVLKGLKDRLSRRFNVSIAEVDHQDLWQRAELAVVVVATDQRRANGTLSLIGNFIEGNGQVRVIDSSMYFL